MMFAFLKRGMFALTATTLCVFAFGASPAISDTGLQNVALSCSDGTNLGLTLSPTEVMSLTDAVAAMTLYPAGLACGLDTQADPPSGGNPGHDYAVGGGNQFTPIPSLVRPCGINFGFSAHTLDEVPLDAKGTFNETVPGGCAGFGMTGELRVRIDCLDVDGRHADMHGIVQKATDSFANDGFVAGGPAYISTDDGGSFDRLGVTNVSTGLSTACGGSTFNEAIVSQGNINVHDADG
jgi:hypothetical protein